MKQLSVRDSFQFAWTTFKERPLLFGGIAVITGLLPRSIDVLQSLVFVHMLQSGNTTSPVLISIPLSLISLGLILYFAVSLIKIFLKVVDKEPISYKDIVKVHKKEFILYIMASFIYAVYVVFGGLLLVIPGIILAVRYQFYAYFVIEKKLSPMDALHASSELTRGNLMKLFIIGLIAGCIQLLGVICNLLTMYKIIQVPGLATFIEFASILVTLPILGILEAYLYRTLVKNSTTT